MRCTVPPYARLINLQYHANIARWSDPPSNTIFGVIAKPTTKAHWPADAVFSLLLRYDCSLRCYSFLSADSEPGFLQRTGSRWLMIRCKNSKNSQHPSGSTVPAICG